jgi:hypothetical protein
MGSFIFPLTLTLSPIGGEGIKKELLLRKVQGSRFKVQGSGNKEYVPDMMIKRPPLFIS